MQIWRLWERGSAGVALHWSGENSMQIRWLWDCGSRFLSHRFLWPAILESSHPFFQTFVIVKRKLTPDHNIVKFSTRFTRLGPVLRWIHNTLTMLWCSFIIDKRTDDKETSVNVMNWTNFIVYNYYLTYYFPTSSYLAEITHPFAGADRARQLKNAYRYICLPFPSSITRM